MCVRVNVFLSNCQSNTDILQIAKLQKNKEKKKEMYQIHSKTFWFQHLHLVSLYVIQTNKHTYIMGDGVKRIIKDSETNKKVKLKTIREDCMCTYETKWMTTNWLTDWYYHFHQLKIHFFTLWLLRLNFFAYLFV